MSLHHPFALSEIRRRATSTNAIYATLAYGFIGIAGALMLWTAPFQQDAARANASFLDALFIATSAISTTGLATVDPASTFSFAGEVLILVLIQIGGLGYMTLASFAFLTIRDRLSVKQSELARAGFGLNAEYSMGRFVRIVVASTFAVEIVGAIALSLQFSAAGVADPIWNGVFHSVSAFCTAGFSLFPTSLEGFKGNAGVLLTISLLSYTGAMGFVVIAEVIDALTSPGKTLSPTTRLILSVTAGMAAFGTMFLLFFEPQITALPADQRLLNAFFQAMTASTTVGFNSVPIGAIAPATVMILYMLMFVGASPSGTGGGLKSTTAALLMATVIASLRGRTDVRTAGVKVPEQRVRQAVATLIIGLLVIFTAVTLLDLTGSYRFETALFEVISALGTVGLSMGATGELNDVGKMIIIAVMFIGRVGILIFFLAFAINLGKEIEKPVRERDVLL